MTTAADLRPYTLTNDEAAAARTAFNWALHTRFLEMWAALKTLPLPALRDMELALDVLLPTVRVEIAERRSGSTSSPVVDGNDRPTVEQVTIACLSPDTLDVEPVPAHIEGWAIVGRAT